MHSAYHTSSTAMKDDVHGSPPPLNQHPTDDTSDITKEPEASRKYTDPKTEGDYDSTETTDAANAIVDNEESDYPEGGTQAWLVVLGAWCAMVPSMGLLNTLAILEAWVSTNELSTMPPSTIGWIFSCYGFFLYFCGAQVGMLRNATVNQDKTRSIDHSQVLYSMPTISGSSSFRALSVLWLP
jgi:hypothetical protein